MKQFSTVEEYVSFMGGQRVLRKILIANNGIGAVKAIRSMRRWAFEMLGDEKALVFVVLATPEDMKANAEFIRMGDLVVDVPGGSNVNNYANVQLIVEVAERWHVDAVWAGWGHASEKPELPAALRNTPRGIAFIGPGERAMHALGDKIASTILAQSAGVPTIDWNGAGIMIDTTADSPDSTVEVDKETYARCTVSTVEEAEAHCARIGFPIMIKASEGGGGKGIRKVTSAEQTAAAFRQVQGEVPGSPIFIMKLAPRSRHLEVQLIADQYGAAIALDGRDCSVQRRHQKIIEEGPPVIAPAHIWTQMEAAAISLAKAVGYANAGTVEYLFTPHDQGFFFLELNPRLQVEHPVTEMITKVNLPACQLQVAMGIPLHRIPSIRRLYGEDPFGTSTIDFATRQRCPSHGHCIAARITAENPEQGFQPTSGGIQELNFRSTPDVWGYFSVNAKGLVHEFADSQFGHLFAGGVDRDAARRNMVLALKELSIRGDIHTTVEYIIDMMQSPDFIENSIDTAWLDQRIQQHGELTNADSAAALAAARVDPLLVVTCGAAVSGHQILAADASEFVERIGRGQVPPLENMSVRTTVELIFQDTKYLVDVIQSSTNTYTIECNDTYMQIDVRALSDGGFLLNVGEQNHVAYAKLEVTGLRLQLDGLTHQFAKEYDPTIVTSEVAGKLARLLVPDGTHLNQGESFAEVEVMKMYMPLNMAESGTIHWKISEGAALSPGDVIASVELDDADCITRAELFSDGLQSLAKAHGVHIGFLTEETAAAAAATAATADGEVDTNSASDGKNIAGDTADPTPTLAPAASDADGMENVSAKLRTVSAKLRLVLQGFYLPPTELQDLLTEFGNTVKDPLLPVCDLEENLVLLRNRIDDTMFNRLVEVAEAFRSKVSQARRDGTAGMPFFTSVSATPPPTTATHKRRSPVAMQPTSTPAASGLSADEVFNMLQNAHQELIPTLRAYGLALPERDRAAFVALLESLWRLVQSTTHGIMEQAVNAILTLLQAYLNVERLFDGSHFEDAVLRLRRQQAGDLYRVYDACRSHINVHTKNEVVVCLLQILQQLAAVSKEHAPADGSGSLVGLGGRTGSTSGAGGARLFSREMDATTARQRSVSDGESLTPFATAGGASAGGADGGSSGSAGAGGANSGTGGAGSTGGAGAGSLTTRSVVPFLAELTNLKDSVYNRVSLGASLALMEETSLSVHHRAQQLREAVKQAMVHQHRVAAATSFFFSGASGSGSGSGSGGDSAMEDTDAAQEQRLAVVNSFVATNISIRDVLLDCFCTPTPNYQLTAMEIYLRKIYQKTHEIMTVQQGHFLPEPSQREQQEQRSPGRVVWLRWVFNTRPSVSLPSLGANAGSTAELAALGRGSSATHSPQRTPQRSPNFATLSRKRGGGGIGIGASESDQEPSDWENRKLPSNLTRLGIFAKFNNFEAVVPSLHVVVNKLIELDAQTQADADTSADSDSPPIVNAMHIAVLREPNGQDECVKKYTQLLRQHGSQLVRARVRRVTFIVWHESDESGGAAASAAAAAAAAASQDTPSAAAAAIAAAGTADHDPTAEGPWQGEHLLGKIPGIYTFRAKYDYGEDALFRHIEPPHAFHLDLPRLTNFRIRMVQTTKSHSGNVHLYEALPKLSLVAREGLTGSPLVQTPRYFLRLVSFTSDINSSDAERVFVEALDTLATVSSGAANRGSRPVGAGSASAGAHSRGGGGAATAAVLPRNHIFLNMVAPESDMSPHAFEQELRQLMLRYSNKINRVGVGTVELKLSGRLTADGDSVSLRLLAYNPTGYVLRTETYVERMVRGQPVFELLQGDLADGPSKADGASAGASSSAPMPTGGSGSDSNSLRATLSVEGAITGGGSSGASRQRGIWHGLPVSTPYPITAPFEQKRFRALVSSDSLYCFDYLELFERAVEVAWEDDARARGNSSVILPPNYFHATELVVCHPDEMDQEIRRVWSAEDRDHLIMQAVERPAGRNDVGMVAWLLSMRTPECPAGRQAVVIANDITFKAGSFGTREDIVFQKASAYARAHRIPRLYLAVNSGARIGMADSIKKLFKVAWTKPTDPARGFQYLYLDEEDLGKLPNPDVVQGEFITVDDGADAADGEAGDEEEAKSGEKKNESQQEERLATGGSRRRFIVRAIVGSETDLGVENLSGSGLIAGETSVAYDEIFTLSLVVGRTVGIGAYLVRLGQRVIQKTSSSPIILTGYQALNKLMGRNIYTNNDQLGGSSIMHPNGVSHLLAENHLDVAVSAVRWLSYVGAVRGGHLPILDITGIDMVERPVRFAPPGPGLPYDPRHLLAGCVDEMSGEWLDGLCDKGSFIEFLSGWAKTVIVGRARLGGIPIGIVVTEMRSTERVIPADPADPKSMEEALQQAGGVWFPDSAFKTATALRDFNAEDLPIFILANWRGFSGGRRDMFDEVLKYGSYIVDALVACKQPVFVYIPPFAELRGGAWVVVDSKINEDVMEMYADTHARGGVLEATGAAAIKFRDNDVVAAAHRLDTKLRQLDGQLEVLQTRLQDLDERAAPATEDKNGEEGAGAADTSTTAEQSSLHIEISELTKEIRRRETILMSVYSQIAVHFADLHDRPGRMQAVGVVRRVVPWEQSRSIFYWRLRRRLAEFDIRRQILRADPSLQVRKVQQAIQRTYLNTPKEHQAEMMAQSPAEGAGTVTWADLWEDDKHVLDWIQANQITIRQRILLQQRERIVRTTVEAAHEAPVVVVEALRRAMRDMDRNGEQHGQVINALRELLQAEGVSTVANAGGR